MMDVDSSATVVTASLAIANAIDRLAAEVKLLREAWLASPTQEINSIMLANLKAQMGGGIMPATILPPKGH